MADDTAQGGATAAAAAAAAAAELHRQPVQDLKCPRCDSGNTKFCYYNNYSLAQPRHYCKTCRRYWTKGGALRNVPVGGGCRKNKRTSKSSSAATRLSLDSMDYIPRAIPEPGSGGGGLKFLNSLPSSLAADFQLGVLPFSRLHSLSNSGACGSFGLDHSPSSVPVPGFNSYPASGAVGVYGDVGGCSSSVGLGRANSSIASSIESLSSINQDLHWKLQQQRLAIYFGGQPGGQKGSGGSSMPSSLPTPLVLENQKDPISLDLAGRSTEEGSEGMKGCVGSAAHNASPAWFNTESSYYAMPVFATASADTNVATATNNGSNSSAGMWNGTPWPAWNDMPQFGTLP